WREGFKAMPNYLSSRQIRARGFGDQLQDVLINSRHVSCADLKRCPANRADSQRRRRVVVARSPSYSNELATLQAVVGDIQFSSLCLKSKTCSTENVLVLQSNYG